MIFLIVPSIQNYYQVSQSVRRAQARVKEVVSKAFYAVYQNLLVGDSFDPDTSLLRQLVEWRK
tara:strand:+ start:11159 stop:11347 length:189 start_codon:yes stop_codon:yes gene_type:complete